MTEFLLRPDADDLEAFVPTQEEIEFLAAFYELDPVTGRRVKRRAVCSRSRGWGKSPFMAGIYCVEAMGPVLCDGWDADGQPVGMPWSTRRTPIVAVRGGRAVCRFVWPRQIHAHHREHSDPVHHPGLEIRVPVAVQV